MTTLGRMIVISGPSGSGKSTICKKLLEDPRIVFSVSATTRKQRNGEVDGRDYHFLDRAAFERMIDAGEFIEHADVYGNLYGTLRAPMKKALASGHHYLLEIDVQGALQLKALGEPGIYVFVAPPDFDELRRRLVRRNSETSEMLERRLLNAREEYEERTKYDHVVVNDDLDRAVAEIRGIIGLPPSKPSSTASFTAAAKHRPKGS